MFDKWTMVLLMVGCLALAWTCWYLVTWYMVKRERDELNILDAAARNRRALVEAPVIHYADPVPDSSPESRMRSANAVGIGYAAPAFDPAPGYFWKQDANGGRWRLYRSPSGS